MDVIGIAGVLLSILIATLFAAAVIDVIWRGRLAKHRMDRQKLNRRRNWEAALSRKRVMVLRKNKLARRNQCQKRQ